MSVVPRLRNPHLLYQRGLRYVKIVFNLFLSSRWWSFHVTYFFVSENLGVMFSLNIHYPVTRLNTSPGCKLVLLSYVGAPETSVERILEYGKVMHTSFTPQHFGLHTSSLELLTLQKSRTFRDNHITHFVMFKTVTACLYITYRGGL